MQTLFLVFLFIFGACIGSFSCCQARRLHLKAAGKKPLGPRSVCLKCKTKLKWYDNLPIISWLALKGKCRKCHAKIGAMEIISEITFALGFLALGTTIDLAIADVASWILFFLVLLFGTTLGFLAIYDGAYGELPSVHLILAIIFSVAVIVFKEWGSIAHLGDIVFSVLILGGLYLILYLVSKGKWVGDGDWLLGLAIGLALGRPWLSLIVLFLSNFLACVVMFPSLKRHKNHQIHFGPFLVVAFVMTYTFADLLSSML